MIVGDFITRSELGQILQGEAQDARRLTEVQATLNKIFALVEAHRNSAYYKSLYYCKRTETEAMMEAILALKEDG